MEHKICTFFADGKCSCNTRSRMPLDGDGPLPCIVSERTPVNEEPAFETCKYFRERGDFCGTARIVPKKESLEKNVNHPRRYTSGKIECIDALESAVVGKSPDEAIHVANIIKYLWRYEQKEPVRSLMSARWYLDRLIEKAKEKYGEGE